MEFFNKLGDTLTGAGKEISSKTKELSETVKLNTQISKEKSEVENLYKQLGKMYFENCNQFAVGEFRELCDSIISKNETIEKLENDLRTVKGYKKCLNCGKMIPIGDKFCCGCGKEVEVPQEKEEEKTVEEAEVEEVTAEEILDEKFEEDVEESVQENETIILGAPEVPPTVVEPVKPPMVVNETKVEEVKELKCPACGVVIEENDVFCSTCGINIKEYNIKEEKEEQPKEEVKEEKKLVCQKCGLELDEDDVFCSNCGEKVV